MRIIIRFIGHKKYKLVDIDYYGPIRFSPNYYNSIIKLNPLRINNNKYSILQIKRGYYPLGFLNRSDIDSGLALKLFCSWHRIKHRLCLSWQRLAYIEGRFNIINWTFYDVIKSCIDLGIDIEGKIDS